jgi:hypothetical protein
MNQIDELGIINVRIAELEASARKIKQELISRGIGKYEGEEFMAEVQHYDRASIDPALVRELCDVTTVAKVTTIKPVDAVVVRRVAI